MAENRREVLKYFEENRVYTEARVKNGIELNRKGVVTLDVTDGAGKRIENAHVEVKQTNHEFKHGANIFMLDEFETDAKNAGYRERFKEVFNLATLPFYWRDLEPEDGKPRFAADSPKVYRRPAPDLCLDYCEKNGITPKEHCLNYDPWTPFWAKDYSVAELKRRLEYRFAECAERYAGRIPGWEVINEVLCRNGNTAFYYEPDFVKWSFDTAAKYFPSNELIINEAADIWEGFRYDRSPYYSIVDRELLRGTRIDAVGMQFHMFNSRAAEPEAAKNRYNPRNLYSVLDCYSRLGRPLQITEITIPCYSDTDEDEAIQAELVRQLYSIWFSTASMEAAIYWNLVDGYAFRAEKGDMKAGENVFYGGLLRFDMSPKPAFYTLRDLFRKEWHTELSLDGERQFSAFYGDYDITVTANGKTVPVKFSFRRANNYALNGDTPYDICKVVIPD